MIRGRRGRKEANWGHVLSDPPQWGAEPPASQPRLLCSIGDLLLLLFTDWTAGGPASTHPNGPVSNAIWSYYAAGTDGNLLQGKAVELWASRLIGLLSHFSFFLSVCLSAGACFWIFPFLNPHNPPPSLPSLSPPHLTTSHCHVWFL